MGFSITTPGASAQLSQLNVNTDGLEALLTLIQTQTDQLEIPIANMDLNLTSIEALTQSLETLQTEIRNQLEIAGSGGNVSVTVLINDILGDVAAALLQLTNIGNNTDQIEALLLRLSGESTVIAVLSDPTFFFIDNQIRPLSSHVANSVMLTAVKSDGTNNVGNIKYGYNATDLRLTLTPGSTVALDAPQGKKLDTAGIWVQGTVNDGIVISLMN
jgi:hypothetical protein